MFNRFVQLMLDFLSLFFLPLISFHFRVGPKIRGFRTWVSSAGASGGREWQVRAGSAVGLAGFLVRGGACFFSLFIFIIRCMSLFHTTKLERG